MSDLRAILILILGLWLGGSLVMGAVVSYNFAGFSDLFDRNPRLAEQAGFDPADTHAKKASVLWVQASELNRVFFEAWNRTQLLLGVLAIALAVWSRAGRPVLILLTLGVALLLWIHLRIEPQLVDLGRQLDFLPRMPPPPQAGAFQRLHGLYFGAELIRLSLVLLATAIQVTSRVSARPGLGNDHGADP
jgi:hypothetical protein